MRKIVLLGAIALLHASVFSQNRSERYSNSSFEYSNKEKYKILFELSDETLLGQDSTILKSIDVSAFDNLQNAEEDIVIIDSNTGLSIVLYSRVKSLLISSRNGRQKSNLNQTK